MKIKYFLYPNYAYIFYFCNNAQVKSLSKEWADRSAIPDYLTNMLKNIPKNVHPMAQLSTSFTILSTESKFAKAYSTGVKKNKYWEVKLRKKIYHQLIIFLHLVYL